MGELLEKHNQATNAKEATPVFKKPALPSKVTRPAPEISRDTAANKSNATTATQKQPRGVKRPRQVPRKPELCARSYTSNNHNSVDIHSSDKENAPTAADANEALSNPKKRTKAGVANASTRNASQATKQAQSKILSPKSSNSRTFPQSPFRVSPQKPSQQFVGRPASPLKPGSPVKPATTTTNLAGMVDNARTRATRSTAATAKKATPHGATATPGTTTSTAGTRTKRTTTRATTAKPAPARPTTRLQNDRKASTSTTTSNTSTGTTVVRPARGAAAGAKKTTASAAAKKATTTGTAAAKKTTTAAAKKAAPAVEQPPAGRRILRKRN